MEKWKIIQTKAGKKIFNAFFLDYKTCSDVSREKYFRGRKTKIIPEVSKHFNIYIKRQYDYLKEGIQNRTIKGKKKSRPTPVYRGTLQPFFDWLDDQVNQKRDRTQNLIWRTMSQLLKEYVTRFFEVLDANGISRSRVIADENADFITNMKSLVLSIQRWVLLNEIIKKNFVHLSKKSRGKIRMAFCIEREDGKKIELPNPDFFYSQDMMNFIDRFFGLNMMGVRIRGVKMSPVSPSTIKKFILYEEKPYPESSKEYKLIVEERLKEAIKLFTSVSNKK
jgi:hypothetical protein